MVLMTSEPRSLFGGEIDHSMPGNHKFDTVRPSSNAQGCSRGLRRFMPIHF
jgi:hypothetical protein